MLVNTFILVNLVISVSATDRNQNTDEFRASGHQALRLSEEPGDARLVVTTMVRHTWINQFVQ